jgi:hypothetical protein
MPLRRSHKVALAAIGVIAGWISLSAVSNFTQIRRHDGYVAFSCREGESEVVCRAASCEFKYYFFVPFTRFLEDKQSVINPQMWCFSSVYDSLWTNRKSLEVCAAAYAPYRQGTIYPQLVVGCNDRLNRVLLEEFKGLGGWGSFSPYSYQLHYQSWQHPNTRSK